MSTDPAALDASQPAPAATTSVRRLILASASPRRIQLLRKARYAFDVEPSGVDEATASVSTVPVENAMQLALAKAHAVALRFPDAVILAADTVVAFGDWIIGKPRDADHARKIIELLGGTTQVVITGLSIVSAAAKYQAHQRVMSAVRMKPLNTSQIDRYIATGLWQGKAGGYGIQDANPIVTCAEADITNVMGLPMKTTQAMLREAGMSPCQSAIS